MLCRPGTFGLTLRGLVGCWGAAQTGTLGLRVLGWHLLGSLSSGLWGYIAGRQIQSPLRVSPSYPGRERSAYPPPTGLQAAPPMGDCLHQPCQVPDTGAALSLPAGWAAIIPKRLFWSIPLSPGWLSLLLKRGKLAVPNLNLQKPPPLALETLAETKGFGFETGATFPSFSARLTV